MNSEAEMRQVLLHAAEKLERAGDGGMNCGHYNYTCMHRLPKGPLLAVSYAEGVLRLLASYLKVEPEKRATATPEPGRTEAKPNGHHARTPAKVERNAAIVAEIEAGADRRDVAARFGISERRVRQITDAAQVKDAAL